MADTALANGATLPSVSSLPAQGHSHQLEADAEEIPLLLEKTSSLLLGFVVGQSERAFAMWEAEGRGKGVVLHGAKGKKRTPFVVVVSFNYF